MSKDVIIFVNAIRPATFEALKEYESRSGRRFEPVVLVDGKIKESIFLCNGQYNLPEKVTVLTADFDSATSVRSVLQPLEERIFAVTAQYENCIEELRQLLPYVPYLSTPTETSLVWATEKKLMREIMEAYDPSLVPRYMEVSNIELQTIQEIESALSYPLIVKPSGLEGSLLVSYVKDRQELEVALSRTFQLIQDSYDTWVKRQKPVVLVEEFIKGDMYTIDVYVDAKGTCYYTPAIGSIVSLKVGYEDPFPYKEFLPSVLGEEEEKARHAAYAACHALGLRSTTVHVELMRTIDDWKIIELGPRIGGWRHELLGQSYGINHIINDILNRAGEKPIISETLRKYVAQFDIYAHSEGVLDAIHGLQEVKDLPSFSQLRQHVNVGQDALHAKNGGDVIFSIVLGNEDPAQLSADCAVMESVLKFDITKHP